MCKISNMTEEFLSIQKIKKYLLSTDLLQIEVLREVDSTNTYARTQAMEGAEDKKIILADYQSAGRGRRGREFYSPNHSGIYMSMILKPKGCLVNGAEKITTMAAVAVCEAIEEVSGKRADIKWVNDIFMDGKKVCGILTEASIGKEGELEYAILGIGINVCPPQEGFPEGLQSIAGTVWKDEKESKKNELAAEIINRFIEYYENFETISHMTKYKQRCFVLGKDIYVLSGNSKRQAKALDLDEECHLKVCYEDGSTEYLSSGEISIRINL